MARGSLPAAFPLARVFDVARVGSDGTPYTVTADPSEREALARLNGLVAIGRLEADLRLVREGKAGVRVSGTVEAGVTQTCVVTLEAFDAEVRGPVDLHFLPEDELVAVMAAKPHVADPEDAEVDVPDRIVGGRIDLGAVTAEFLALALDPYPRKPGVVFEDASPESENRDPSPFAGLERLRMERPN